MENVLKEINTQLEKADYNPSIKQDVADYLCALCAKNKPKHILEIGTNLGKSGLLMLKSSPNSKLTTIEKQKDIFALAGKNFLRAGVAENVKQILGDAKEGLKTLPSREFDLIFLDGPKAQYINYLPDIKRLLCINGIFVADNVFFKGKVFQTGNIEKKHRTIIVNLKKFLFQVQNDEDFETTILNLGDGLSVCKKIK